MDLIKAKILLPGVICLLLCAHYASAGQGCPFDNASCQDYCASQGCNFGYCGHFAWIQCICRKCGDEWGYYDKVHYRPDQQVNQTELDSLKLNGSEPLILTNNNEQPQQQQSQQQAAPASGKQQQQQQQQQQQPQQKYATLTTLLIPDLSGDNSKLDLNDIPDENSDKFLDFLAKNHEKLVQATAQQQHQTTRGGLDLSDESAIRSTTAAPLEEETVEIQISSSNNNTNQNASRRDSDDDEWQQEGGADDSQRAQSAGPVTRLLKMAVAERSSEEIERRR